MSQPKIVLSVPPSGPCTIRTEGYAGNQCQEASRFLEQALGTVVEDVHTSEMYHGETTQSETETEPENG